MKTTYTLSIPYSNEKIRSRAKKAGGVWDSARKVWVITTTPDRMRMHFQLHDFIISEQPEVAQPGMVDSGVGFMMLDTPANRERVARLGFDAIEDAE